MRLIIVIIFGILMQQAWAAEPKPQPDKMEEQLAELRAALSDGIQKSNGTLVQLASKGYALAGISEEAVRREIEKAQFEAILNELPYGKAGRMEAWMLAAAAVSGDKQAASTLSKYAALKIEDFEDIKYKHIDRSRLRELWRHVHALECLGFMKDEDAITKLVGYANVPFKKIEERFRRFEKDEKLSLEIEGEKNEALIKKYCDTLEKYEKYACPRHIASKLALRALYNLQYKDCNKIAMEWLQTTWSVDEPKPQSPEEGQKVDKRMTDDTENFTKNACGERNKLALRCLYLLGKKEALDHVIESLDDNTIALETRVQMLNVFQNEVYGFTYQLPGTGVGEKMDPEILFEKFKALLAKLDSKASMKTVRALMDIVDYLPRDYGKEGQLLLLEFIETKKADLIKKNYRVVLTVGRYRRELGLTGVKEPPREPPAEDSEF